MLLAGGLCVGSFSWTVTLSIILSWSARVGSSSPIDRIIGIQCSVFSAGRAQEAIAGAVYSGGDIPRPPLYIHVRKVQARWPRPSLPEYYTRLSWEEEESVWKGGGGGKGGRWLIMMTGLTVEDWPMAECLRPRYQYGEVVGVPYSLAPQPSSVGKTTPCYDSSFTPGHLEEVCLFWELMLW